MMGTKERDVFISHASEDKAFPFAREATCLRTTTRPFVT